MSLSFFKRLFEREDNRYGDIEAVIDYQFKDKKWLSRSLSHRSSVDDSPSNERLEHLGDAVLGLIVSEFLFRKFPHMDEGELTKLKASLVNEAILCKVAGKFNLGDYVFLSKEEEKSGGRTKPSIVADGFEALLGAIYLDGGLEAAGRLVERYLLNDIDNLGNDRTVYNFKGELLELMQGSGQGIPRYEIVEEHGPDHLKVFEIAVSIDGKRYGMGKGSTKKEAEQQAAEQALKALKENANDPPDNLT